MTKKDLTPEEKIEYERIKNGIENAWTHRTRIDSQLMEGVNRSELFTEYAARTGCPSILRDRYEQLQQRSGIAPHSKNPDPADRMNEAFLSYKD